MARLRFLFYFIPVALLVVAGCAGADRVARTQSPPSPVVAEFGTTTLTLAEFEERYARSSGSHATAASHTIEDYEDFLERYVNFRLKVDEARRLGLHQDPEIVSEIETYRDQLAQPFLMERAVLDGIVRDIYEKQKEEIAASHILVLVDQHAAPADTLEAFQRLTAVRDSIAAGQIEFEVAARRHSEDPSVAQNAGYLGYFTGGRMILAFEEMAYQTPVGSVSPVFRTAYGYHILQVRDRRAAEPEIQASHILVRLGPDASPADSIAAYQKIEAIQARLDAGEDFAVVAAEASEDPGSAPRGGDLGFFSRDRMVPEFADAAYALEKGGDRSGVVRSQFGLHLIELTDRREPETLEQQYDRLKRLAERLPRTQQRRQEIGRAHRDAVGSRFDEALVRRAFAQYPEERLLDEIKQHGFRAYTDSVFAEIGSESYTLGEFTGELQNVRLNPQASQPAQLVTILDQMVNERGVVLAARNLETHNEEFRRIMTDYIDGVLLFRLTEDSVWTAASRDTLGLRAFYEGRADQYRFPDRRRVIGFYSRSDSLLNVAATRLDEGQAPVDIAADINAEVEEGGVRVRVDTMYLASRPEGTFGQAFDLEPGQRTEPFRQRGEFLLLYYDGIDPARVMTFDEARAHAITDYQEELDRRLVERLRREADARLFPEQLADAFADHAFVGGVPTGQGQAHN
jgi:peptidyl-prolyl cis-trans isomerase SurA